MRKSVLFFFVSVVGLSAFYWYKVKGSTNDESDILGSISDFIESKTAEVTDVVANVVSGGFWEKLALAFYHVEGDGPNTKATRNNNPGNFRYFPELTKPGYVLDKAIRDDGTGFAVFATFEDGLAAFERQLRIWYSRYPEATIQTLANLQLGNNAGDTTTTKEGNPTAYAANVAAQLATTATAKISVLKGLL